MEYNRLVAVLKSYTSKLSQKSYSEVSEMHRSNETVSETYKDATEECYVQYWTSQQFQDKDSTWIDLFITANDMEIKIGGFLIFHDTGKIDVDEGLYLHSFEGLPKKIGRLSISKNKV